MTYLALVAAVLLALVHVWGVRLTFSPSIPRSHWLSMAGGTSVAFVFIHILPELVRGQEQIDEAGRIPGGFLEEHVYLLALVGLTAFYGLEQRVKIHHKGEREGSPGLRHHIFWVQIGAFSLYNAIIGYLLLHREISGVSSLVVFTLALMLHFIVNDHSLRERHQDAYHDAGRWLLAGAVLAGWLAGIAIQVSEAVVGAMFAFIAGALILNVLKEELPDERESKFWAFATGAVAYTLLMLLVD